MADGTVTAGSNDAGGPGFEADVVGGVAWPYSKLAFGPSGTQTRVADADAARLPVKPVGPKGSLTDKSGTIATGGTSQKLCDSNSSRNYLFVFNPPSATEWMYINFGSAAAADKTSIGIGPGGSFLMTGPGFVCTDQVNVIAATTSHAYGAKEG